MKSPTSELLANLKVLVVDDEPDAVVFTRTVLEDCGATVAEAANGVDALAQMRREKPDLVTLDLGMPGKNGVEVFHEMREDPELRDVPVCIITGRPELRRLIYDGTARRPEGYLNKPVDAATLLRNVRKIMELRQRVGQRATDAPEAPGPQEDR